MHGNSRKDVLTLNHIKPCASSAGKTGLNNGTQNPLDCKMYVYTGKSNKLNDFRRLGYVLNQNV